MRRRRFLTAGAAGLAAGLPGCGRLGLSSESHDGRRHPLADATATVRVENRSDTDHDVQANAREALAYWADNGSEFAGFDVDFEVVTDDADLTIQYVDGPEACSDVEGYSDRVLGCAPVLTPEHRLPETVTAIVVAGSRPYAQIRTTTKHELGHVLGLNHDDPPAAVMSDRPADRIPLYEVRVEIWETVLAGKERADVATEAFNDGIATWNDEAYDAAESTFRQANADFEAAGSSFADALDRAATFEADVDVETVDLPGLRSHLGRLVDRTELAVEFTGSMAEAAVAATREDADEANRLLRSANEAIASFNEAPSPQIRDVAIGLGLVRGYDRDDAVVGRSEGGV